MSVWDELVGQAQVVATFQAAATGARPQVPTAAMSHAWLVTGPPGSGRSTAALAFAAALECSGAEPGCGQCEGCRQTLAGTHPDVVRLATDRMIITIDEVKSLIEQAGRMPWQGRWRIILVEDADRMDERTTNVLLKSIEEPPPYTVWLLCTPSSEDVLPTIRSRCRLVRLCVPSAQAVADLLVKRDGAEPQLALRAARASQSHIGLARHLAKDEGAWERRRAPMSAPGPPLPCTKYSIPDSGPFCQRKVLAAVGVEAEDALTFWFAKTVPGLEGESRIPPAMRGQIKALEDNQKRRAKRAVTDVLDRAMVDLLSFYRDVLSRQLGSQLDSVNLDLEQEIGQVAAGSTAEQTLARVAAVEQCRTRLKTYVSPLLALESLMVQLRPQA